MQKSKRAWLPLLSALACFALFWNAPRASSSEADAKPVLLLELFTSQGCSSCPPADALLREAKARWGEQVVPLAFHVDYWTYLGWRDPFSSSDWTKRQERYAAFEQSRRIYTPQLVVGGDQRLVGSRRGEVVGSIDRALATLTTTPVRLRGRFAGGGLKACVAGTSLPHAGAELYVAIFEDGLVTRIPRGENAGRTLRNDFVVRSLTRIDLNQGDRIDIPTEPDWNTNSLGAVAFVQDANNGKIIGAGALASSVGETC